jgi:transposase
MEASKHPATRRYPPELRERAVRMVFEAIDYNSERHGVITRVAAQLGVGAESLRTWVRQSEVDSSHQAGTTTEE